MNDRRWEPRTGVARRGLVAALPLLFAAGCSTMDCGDPTRYVGAELRKPVVAPAGLDQVERSETFKVPGGDAPQDYAGGACLARPPQLVAPPAPADAPKPAPADAPKPPPLEG